MLGSRLSCRASFQPPPFLLLWGNAQSFLGLTSGRRRASHGSVFHFRAPVLDGSFPDGVADDGVFLGDRDSYRGSLLLGGSTNQPGPLPKSPLPQATNPGSGREEDRHPPLPTGEHGPGVTEGSVSLGVFFGAALQLEALGQGVLSVTHERVL